MSTRICALVGFCLLVPSIAGRAQQPAAPAAPPIPLIDAEHLIMQPEQAATGARVMGDGSKPGFYVTRARFAPGRGSKPHYHDQDRYVTVIKGTGGREGVTSTSQKRWWQSSRAASCFTRPATAITTRRATKR